MTRQTLDQYRTRVKELIRDMEADYARPGGHSEAVRLASALVVLERKREAVQVTEEAKHVEG